MVTLGFSIASLFFYIINFLPLLLSKYVIYSKMITLNLKSFRASQISRLGKRKNSGGRNVSSRYFFFLLFFLTSVSLSLCVAYPVLKGVSTQAETTLVFSLF